MKISKEDGVFLDILFSRIPERKELINVLEQTLSIEREAIYRRLRGKISFTFTEIARICRKLNISIDNIIGMGVDSSKIRPARIAYLDYLEPTETDYYQWESYIQTLKLMENHSESEFICATNSLPQLLYLSFDNIHRYFLLKWKYQQAGTLEWFKFSDILIPQRLKEITMEYCKANELAKSITFIFDRDIFKNLINDIKFFSDIDMIGGDDIVNIREELLILVDKLEERMAKAVFGVSCHLNVFLTNLNLESSHMCLKICDSIKISMIKSFVIPDTSSMDNMVYEKMCSWMQSLIRTSVLISGSGEFDRRNFLKNQREFINTL